MFPERNIIGTNRERERQMFGFWGATGGGKRKKGGEEVECPEILEWRPTFIRRFLRNADKVFEKYLNRVERRCSPAFLLLGWLSIFCS